jgi:hypothetical protein
LLAVKAFCSFFSPQHKKMPVYAPKKCQDIEKISHMREQGQKPLLSSEQRKPDSTGALSAGHRVQYVAERERVSSVLAGSAPKWQRLQSTQIEYPLSFCSISKIS